MKRIIVISLLAFYTIVAFGQSEQATNLLPMPQHMEFADGFFRITPGFAVAVNADKTDIILYNAVNRTFRALNRKTALFFGQQYITSKDDNDTSAMQIKVIQNAVFSIGVDESYDLTVSAKHIMLNANTTIGALRGLATFLQLLKYDKQGFFLPMVNIHDAPRFVWRGLMIDAARHFIPVDVIKRNIDAMEAVKMNVLHLHLTDDEGFRIESKIYPQLQNQGSNGDYYSQVQIKELIKYAADRAIMILPEFDMPGHTTSWLAGMPELASAPGPYEPGPRFQITKPGSKPMALGEIMKMVKTAPTPAFDVSKQSTYNLMDKFFGEMAALFPAPYIHIGADENNGVAWKNNPAIVDFMSKNKIADTHALQAYFVKRVVQILAKHHKKTIGWEELFSNDLPVDVTVQVWQNAAIRDKALAHSNSVTLSAGFYLDQFMPAHVYYNNPNLPDSLSTTTNPAFLGGEAAQWTEVADKNNIETRIWPRAAAIAERLWSAATIKNVDDMYSRLSAISSQLDEQGLHHITEYEQSLRRFAAGADITPLKTLTDVLCPVKGYKKLFAKMTKPQAQSYQNAPLVTMSDLVFVDSELKRRFREMVRNYLSNKDTVAENYIGRQLNSWRNNSSALASLLDKMPVRDDMDVHSENLTKAAIIGLEAMAVIKTGAAPQEEWTKQKLAELATLDKPHSEMELAIIPEITALVKQQLANERSSFPVF